MAAPPLAPLIQSSLPLPRRWWPWLVGILVTIFIAGLLATILFAFALQGNVTPLDSWLVPLLEICSWLPYVLVLASLPTVWSIWRNRSRLARRLAMVMLFQISLVSVLAFLPLLLVTVTFNNYFSNPVEKAVAISSQLSSDLLAQEHEHLEVVGQEVIAHVGSLDTRSISVGLVLDELRATHGLDVIAIIDSNGQIHHASPGFAVIEGVTPFVMQRLDDGAVVSSVAKTADGTLRLVRVQPLTDATVLPATTITTSSANVLWLERSLAAATSANINAVEEVSVSYHQAKAASAGVRRGLGLVVINVLLLLLFVALHAVNYTGTRLGWRLGELSSTMESVASMALPRGRVPVEGNDEITVVSGAFNEMVDRVGTMVEREKNIRTDLEDIQDAIDAGLIVLDGANRIINANRAAYDMVAIKRAEPPETLASLAARTEHLAELGTLIGSPAKFMSGKIVVGQRKLWVRIVPKGANSNNRIVILTDISEPLAFEELRARQEAISYTLHGLKNPLQPLLYHAESLDKLYPALDAATAEILESKRASIIHNIKRINEQIEAMRKLQAEDKMFNRAVDVNAVVRTCLRHFPMPEIKVKQELAADLQPALIDPDKLNEVLENLICNAQQQFDLEGLDGREITIQTYMDKGMVTLVVTDNAGGIPPDRLAQVFRPHMSVKLGGQGLGLARVKATLDSVDGDVTVANIAVGERRGAQFVIAMQQAPVASPT